MAEFMFSSTPHEAASDIYIRDDLPALAAAVLLCPFHDAGYVMKITLDGRLESGPGLSEDEATQRMFKALQAMFKQAMN